MNRLLKTALTDKFPQNFIIKHPVYGVLIVFTFTLIFALIYRPLGSHAGRNLGYGFTMIAYALIAAAVLLGLIKILVRFKYFSNPSKWTFGKELIALFILLSGMGIAIYFAAFVIEEPAERWNMSTFLDSLVNAFLIGIPPFLFFTVFNYFRQVLPVDHTGTKLPSDSDASIEEQVQINSQLKKESLCIYPGQLVYAESESNYVNFYLLTEDKIRKKVIRNSISDVEQQLAHIPYLYRSHRAFIVNLKHICSKKGNSLGYRLKLTGVDHEIPVARKKTSEFNKLINKQHLSVYTKN